MQQPKDYLNNVFINCPFDVGYHSMFEAIVFTIHDCGFIARCAREEDDSGNLRFTKLIKIIEECKYGIHDISKADLDTTTGLARFNMPLELGLFMGSQRYSTKDHYNKDKKALVLDSDPYRYQIFISDLAGTDISSHQNSPEIIISKIRTFLFNNSRRKSIAGGPYIFERFQAFIVNLPQVCEEIHWERDTLTFVEYTICVTEWIKQNSI